MNDTNVIENNPKAKADEVVAVFDHNEERWENSTDRVPVFSIVKDNPRAGEVLTEATEGVSDGVVTSVGEPATYHPAKLTITHTMPRKPNAGLGLAYLKRARREGPDAAGSWLLEFAIGSEGYDDLVEELEGAGAEGPAILENITRKIQTIALGGLDAPKG